MINSISFGVDAGSTMTLNCTRAPEKIEGGSILNYADKSTLERLIHYYEEQIEELRQIAENLGGLSEQTKSAILTIAEKVAYVNTNGATYLQALRNALYPDENN